MFDIKKLRFILYVFYMKYTKKIITGSTLHPLSVNVFVQTWHISCSVVGLQSQIKGSEERTDGSPRARISVFPPKTRSCSLYCCIKSVFKKVQDVLCVRLWSFANLHLQLFPSQAAVEIAVTAVLHETGDTIGFYWRKSSMCCSGRKSVFHLEF